MDEEGSGESWRKGWTVTAYTWIFPGDFVSFKPLFNDLTSMFQSVHSNLCEKNCLLYTLLQHGKHDHDHGGATADDTIAGVETTVDRSSKNNRIRNWINQVQQILQISRRYKYN